MMNLIKQTLQFTDREFDLLVFDIYFKWCDIHANESNVKIQVFLNNPLIGKWFKVEFKKLLNEFKTAFKRYENIGISVNDKRDYFVNIVTKIYDYYPSALLTEVKPKKSNVQ